MIFKAGGPLIALGLIGLVLSPARAADSDARNLAANCTGCHGTNGVSTGGIPSRAGIERTRIATLMQEFRDGKRPSTVMQQLAKGYTDEQIEAIAAWLAAEK